MDNFMDKLAQKFSAQDVIRANSQAEAEEMKRLQLQVAEYEKILQEMRKQNYKNAELTDKINTLLGENANKLKDLQSDELQMLNTLKDLLEEQIRVRDEDFARREEEKRELQEREMQTKLDMKAIENMLKSSDEFVHKENVKVYRNVQAVVVEELMKQTENLCEDNQKLKKKVTVAIIFSIVAGVFTIVNSVLQIISMLNI